MQHKIKNNIPKIFVLNFFMTFLVVMPIIVPYWQSHGLSLKQVYQLQAIFGGVLILLDAPAGYISDLFGRKWCLITAAIFNGFAYTLFVFGTEFWHFAIFEICIAMALGLYSGCDTALLYDSLDAIGDTGQRTHVVGKKLFFMQLGEGSAALLAAGLSSVAVFLPVKAQAVGSWIPLLVALTLVEPPRKTMAGRKHRENFKFIYESVFKHSRLLTLLVLTNIFFGFATYVAVWSYQPLWEFVGIPTKYFGLIWASINLLMALIAKNAQKIEANISSASALLLIGVCPFLGFLGLGMFQTQWALGFIFFFALCRGLNGVILTDGIVSRVPSEMRATVSSICSLGMRAIFFIFGPLMGAMLDKKGFSPTYLSLAAFYLILFFILILPILSHRQMFRPVVKKTT